MAPATRLQVVRTKSGRPIGVEEAPGRATDVIAAQLGDIGRIAYNDLSTIAHGTLYGIVSRVSEVADAPKMEGVTLVKPTAKVASLRNLITISLLAYRHATDRGMELYGWDMTQWTAWKKESARILVPLLRGVDEGRAASD
jgi:hypothetical protein